MPSTPANKTSDLAQLDKITGGAFTAATAGERAGRVREWLLTQPSNDLLAEVFRELSGRDKGAAKLLRERLDDAKRAKMQESMSAEWALKAQALLDLTKLNIADAMAWQRDAAKAGAPLSKEPLASLKVQIAERVRLIEDLQHQAQVQREAAVLLAQRIEVMSTKPWREAQAVAEALGVDVAQWQAQAAQLVAHASWPSTDLKFTPMLEASRAQLVVVWEAFQLALQQTLEASQDANAPLPGVGVWAEELRAERALANPSPKPAKVAVDPQVREAANAKVREVLVQLEAQTSEGQGKASAGAASALRQALKEFGKVIDHKLENQAQAALAAAGELEGWQRWRADQLREELLIKAEGLLKRPEGQAIGGRKMQETLRTMREQWKQTDQGGVPNHAMWKRFDEACNEAHKVVEAWLEKLKADAVEHRKQRLALIAELNTWAEENRTARDDDWKGFSRILHQFGDRWRDAGHLGEKAFAELQPLWKAAITAAAAPLEALQAQSLALRRAMIEEAKVLGEAPVLRIDAVRALQQRWQAQAHQVPIDRRQEQKLWDAFRKPIDDAFNRKTLEREKAEASLGQRDRVVIDASKALQAANAGGDAQVIRAAIAALEAALQGQAQAQAQVTAAGAQEAQVQAVADSVAQASAASVDAAVGEVGSEEAVATTDAGEAVEAPPAAPVAEVLAPKPVPKPVVAMRGDDRPGMKRDAPAADAGRAGKWGDRKDAGRGGRDARPGMDGRPRPEVRGEGRGFGGADARGDRFDPRNAPPRLGDAAFRAQREALESAQMALRKLAAQAHGEALTQLLSAWESRDSAKVPSQQELGNQINAATRSVWTSALNGALAAHRTSPPEALLRLEMAAEIPTPADHLNARRALQLQLLTRRNDPSPAQTWGQDVAIVLSAPYAPDDARRLQGSLKALLKR
ncbi:MAG: DUF349 domain-containing protein [Rhodoferax sp.]|nr:DUF349 domain-containing protein [Rhodoferax sp.]